MLLTPEPTPAPTPTPTSTFAPTGAPTSAAPTGAPTPSPLPAPTATRAAARDDDGGDGALPLPLWALLAAAAVGAAALVVAAAVAVRPCRRGSKSAHLDPKGAGDDLDHGAVEMGAAAPHERGHGSRDQIGNPLRDGGAPTAAARGAEPRAKHTNDNRPPSKKGKKPKKTKAKRLSVAGGDAAPDGEG